MICNPAVGCWGVYVNGVDFFSKLISSVISLLIVIGVVVFVFYFLTGGIKYITSGGNKTKIEEARNSLTYAVTGLVILLSFFAILSLIECFFGIGLRQVKIGFFDVSFGGAPVCK